MKALSHWMEERVAWWPVLKKWNEPRRARITGPIGEEVRELRSRISTRERICQVMREMAPAPIGFWTVRMQSRMLMTRRK